VPKPEKLRNPLIITDATGDQVIFNYWPGRAGEAIGAPVTIATRRVKGAEDLPDSVAAALIVPDRIREVIEWLAATLGEDTQGQPYTDEELGRGQSDRRDNLIKGMLEQNARRAKETGVIRVTEVEGDFQEG
jgi:hypothetical protein